MTTAIRKGNVLPTVFSYDEHYPLRTIVLEDETWFAAMDVCEILKHTNTSKAIKRLDQDELTKLWLGSRQGHTWFVNESGLYNLVFRSNLPEASRFRRWVLHEVLPTLRKKGFYSMTVAPDLLGLHGVIISGHPYYDYLDLLGRVGLSTTSGSKDHRRRKNPQEFCELNGRIRVSGHYAGYIMRMNRVRKEQADIRDRRIKHFNRLLDQQASGQIPLFAKGGMV